MDCAELESNLTDFLDGVLDSASEAAAIEHLATCAQCAAVLGQTRSVISLANQHGRVTLTTDERAQLLRRILADDNLHHLRNL